MNSAKILIAWYDLNSKQKSGMLQSKTEFVSIIEEEKNRVTVVMV